MGLAIEVGSYAELLEDDPEGAEWFLEDIAAINKLLRSQGLPEHQEPEQPLPEATREGVNGFPYGCLHTLRRVYAHSILKPDVALEPLDSDFDPANDTQIEHAFEASGSHLLGHSDAEGYYLPISFSDVLINPDIAGAMVGSSHRLLEELISIASMLDIDLIDGTLSNAEAERINTIVDEESSAFGTELMVWICLYEAARLSVKYGCAIQFG